MNVDFFARRCSFLTNHPEAASLLSLTLVGGHCGGSAMVGTELPTTIGCDLSFGSSFSPWFFAEWPFDFL
ncbi:MAG: hypothetical protein CBE00_03070 [Planctomycetaceae bacterium TMED240]|nr:hypothetical protein [Rhodopirellula sp.]OUX07877.1 MAG: hypothetical protein CBE00_03070 [Planctomycetaceae bacterium TMED240]